MFSAIFIARPKFAFVISIVITLAGLIALQIIPVAQYPDITPPVIEVSASYPGASAEVVEQTVAAPIEAEVNGVDDMIYMSSSSSNDGSYTLNVSFAVGTDPDLAAINVQNRVAQATPMLPEEVSRQGVSVKKKSTNMLMVINLVSPDQTHDALFLSNYASINLRDAVIRLPGALPDFTRGLSIGAGVLAAVIVFDPERLRTLRPHWLDGPIALWCVCPFFASLSNGLGAYDGFSEVLNSTLQWGVPYLLGRAYFGDLKGLRVLALGIVVILLAH